jgi:type I restriction enzyme R subunit
VNNLEQAEKEDTGAEEDLEDMVLKELRSRGKMKDISFFAFTATPKNKTLEMFGEKQFDGTYKPFHLYSMRQAIEEGFILDVLKNYTTYQTYFALLKKIENDPEYKKSNAIKLAKRYIDLHNYTIDKKIDIIITHFVENIQYELDGLSKAMVVTKSRLHAVRFKLAFDKYIKEHNYLFKTLVAFSGTVKDHEY